MTWDPKHFGKIDEFIETLEQKKRNLVVIVDPHIKNDNYYPFFYNAMQNSKFIT